MVAKKEVAKKPQTKVPVTKAAPKTKEVPKTKAAPKSKAAPKTKAVPKTKAQKVKEADDNSRYITKTAIRFLARRAGIKRLDKSVYDSVLKYVESILRNLLQKSVVFAVHMKKRTLQQNHIDSALRFMGTPVALACANNIKTLLEKHLSRKVKKPEEGKERTRHFKQGNIMATPTTNSNVLKSIAATAQYVQEAWTRDIQQPFDKKLQMAKLVQDRSGLVPAGV
jgi:histone H3/H4